MTLTRYRFTNNYILLSFLLLFGALTISWIFSSNFFEIMTLDYQAPDLVGTKEDIQANFLWSILTWESLVDSSMFYLINFIPILFILPTLALFNEKRSYFILGKHRFPDFKQEVYKSVFQYVMISALTVVASFLLFYSIGGLFVHRSIDDIGGFASALPKNFYANSPYLFFVFMVVTIYLALAVVFSILSCGLILLLDREYQVLISLLLFYIILGNLGAYTEILFLRIFDSFIAFNTLYSTYELFLPVLFVGFLGTLLLVFSVNKLAAYKKQ